jgi:hypothetical protein
MNEWILMAMLSLVPGRDHRRLASAIDTAVDEAGPVFAGPDGALRTRALLVAIAFRESAFKLDAVGDHGRSKCAFQVWGGSSELLTDADACAKEGLRRLRMSIRACPAHPVAVFAAGPDGCTSAHAQRISYDRMYIARNLIRTVKDANE